METKYEIRKRKKTRNKTGRKTERKRKEAKNVERKKEKETPRNMKAGRGKRNKELTEENNLKT